RCPVCSDLQHSHVIAEHSLSQYVVVLIASVAGFFCVFFFFSSRRRHTRSVSAFLLNRSSDLLRRITRTENILHRNFTRRQVAIQNRVASNIGISQSTFSVKVLNLFSRSRRKTNKRKSKHSAMLRNKETRHRMFIG